MFFFFCSSRSWTTSCALVSGVQTCAIPIWVDVGILGEFDQQPLVRQQMIQDSSEEEWIVEPRTDIGRTDSRQREKPTEPIRIRRQIGECAQGHRLRLFAIEFHSF